MNEYSRCEPVRGISILRAGLLSLALSLTMALPAHATTISGFVWHDLNEDGIQDVGEPGISNAIVQLLEFPASNVVDGVLTDVNGIYLFTNVAPGDYFIRIPPPSGFTVTTNNAGVDPTLDSDIDPGGQTPTFTFVGDPITDLDAGFYIIQPGISLTKLAGDAPDGGILYVTNGTEVTYTYIVTNTGNIHLSFIFLTDDVLFPAGGDTIVELANCFGFDTNVALNLAPGEVITYTTQAVINASVTNNALVEALAIDFKTCSIIGNVDPAVAEDDAIVIVVTPGYTLEKTVSAPVGRAAAIGESVVFEITVVNTGDVELVTVPLVDTYDTTFLSYVSAIPPSVDNVNDGIINWANLGPLPIGASTSVFATFTAIASTDNSETNTVVAAPTTPPEVPGVPPQTNEVPYDIRNPGFGLIKSLLSPLGRAAAVGETIVFELSVVNTGDVPLVTLPLDDTFDSSVLSYQSSVPPADAVGAGTLAWIDLGPLPVGAETSVVVSLTALASTVGSSETNIVVASPTTPPDLPPVPPQTNDVPYDISNPGFLLTKTLISPLGRAAAVGESILFNLTVENTGDVALVTVPLEDTFLPAFLTYQAAEPPADTVLAGTLTWNDIGPLPVGASTSVVVSLLATDSTGGFAETNIVVASPTTPPNQPPVPPQTNDVPYEISHPGYSLLKTLNSPTGRSAEIGETIEFTLSVSNTGDVTLVTVPLDDTFDPAFLSFQSAVPPPDSSAPGSLAWLNLGPLSSGSSTSVVVSFTAIASSQSESQTNTVVATPTTPPDQPPVPPRTNEVPYEISNPGYALVKTLISPSGRSAQVGETLVFSLNVVNTGDVVLVTVPLNDTFDPAFLSFISSVPPANSVGPGSLAWNDVGPLPVGASTSVVVSFTAVASSQSESQTNTVVATPTTPPDEPPVPPRTNEVPYQISSPGFSLAKAVVSPVGRAAEIGETLVFSLTVANTGDVDLVTVPVDDFFNPLVLAYQSSVPPADSVGVGTLAWADVGPLPVGASTVLVVNATALASTVNATETNVVVASPTTPPDEPPVPPQTNDVPYEISNPGYELIKTLSSPTGRPAVIEEPVVFTLTVRNTGDVDIVSVDLDDTYDPSFLSFQSAVPPASFVDGGNGLISWTNLGPVVVGASTSVVVTFEALAMTTQAETNVVVATPTTPPDQPPLPPKTNDVPYEIMTLTIGDTVWLDLNGNGNPDENLAVQGLNGVTVRLFDITGGVTNLVASAVTASNLNWRGYYIFTNLPFANYVIEIDLSTVPFANPPGGGFPGMPQVPLIPTTPLRFTVPPIPPSGSFLEADFGFISANPTAVELVSFTGEPVDDGILIEWETATEINNLGFHLYRAGSPSGPKTRITPDLIDGQGTGRGRVYQWLDHAVTVGDTYYYWLEDIEYDMTAEIHGPIRVSLDVAQEGVMATLSVTEPGLYVLPARVLREAGIELAAISPSRIDVQVDRLPVASYVMAWGASLRDNDTILFYIDDVTGPTAEISVVETDDPHQMTVDYAGPNYEEGDVFVGQVDAGQVLRFEISPDRKRYLISGFETSNAWLLDVSVPTDPVLLFGAETLWKDQGTAIYFSVPNPHAIEGVVMGDHALKIIDRVQSANP